ncbi:MAG: hypothetical protein FJ102_17755 [Deltaproteobacteria bacterium]|nr:hypothetical protein [Deltaproteobacteria bacterium]
MRVALASALLVACSDYNLAEGNTKEPNQRDSGRDHDPEVDTSDTEADPGDSGGGDVPASDVPDGKVDVMLIIDIAYWYDCYRVDLAVDGGALVDALYDSGADVAVGVATYDDYMVDGEWFQAWAGYPYTLPTQLTTDRSRAKNAMTSLEFQWGGDDAGDGYEAIVQAADGLGYDQDCDGKYDEYYDIKPFKPKSSDAFGGGVGGLADSGATGSGDEPGVGWRENSKRVIVVFAENIIRDKNEGHKLPSGACHGVASQNDAASAIRGIQSKFLGVNAYEYQMEDPRLQEQLEALADGTGSKIDKDNDGNEDELAVLSGSWDWPETKVIVNAIWDLAD